MPVYNAENYLDESISSILNQTLKDFEFIIINDGSKDNSLKIIKEYQKQDKRIILIKNLKNLGLQKTLNKGLKQAKGKYIARMDADDISLPNRFEVQYNYLEKHLEIFLVGSSAIVIDENGNRLGVFKKFNNPKKIKKKLEKTNCIIHPSIMFRNTREFLYREKFKTSEDYDFYLQLLISGKRITNLPNFLLKYRITKNSFVSTMPNQEFYFRKAQEFYQQRLKERKDNYKNLHPPKEKTYPKNQEQNSLKVLIFIQLSDGQRKNVRKNISNYFKTYGFNKRLFLYYILSLLPHNFFRFLQK